MIQNYYLMHEDHIVTAIRLDETGTMLQYSIDELNAELAPFCGAIEHNGLKFWWNRRSIPLKRDRLAQLLRSNHVSVPTEYMVNNLGLSLTDHYWIRPVNQVVHWKNINLFDNDFHSELILPEQANLNDVTDDYTANSTLNGDLEKSWKILHLPEEKELPPWFVNDVRCLLKGNKTRYAYQSVNEVLMDRICEFQSYDNYARYRLVKIANKPYRFGCLTPNFCGKDLEFIPAADMIDASTNPKDNSFETFLSSCTEHGLDEDELRQGLDFMILADFVISNEDRHMNNLGVLRNAHTLKFIGLAPIFDSGNSMFFNSLPYKERNALCALDTNSFEPTELRMLTHVTNPFALDVSKLPSGEEIVQLYNKTIPEMRERNEQIGLSFDVKKELLEDFQQGKLIDKNGEKKNTYSWLVDADEDIWDMSDFIKE